MAARKATQRAVRAGKLTRPDVCSRCGNTDDIQAHHKDYDAPLDVVWLCGTCHRATHAGERRGKGRPAKPIPQGTVTPTALAQAEAAFRRVSARAEEAREHRNALVLTALAEGWTHAHIATTTGMTRARVGQIAQTSWRNS